MEGARNMPNYALLHIIKDRQNIGLLMSYVSYITIIPTIYNTPFTNTIIYT